MVRIGLGEARQHRWEAPPCICTKVYYQKAGACAKMSCRRAVQSPLQAGLHTCYCCSFAVSTASPGPILDVLDGHPIIFGETLKRTPYVCMPDGAEPFP
jgi:hypothetical protein